MIDLKSFIQNQINPNHSAGKNIKSEAETRKNLLNVAKMQGCDGELIELFNKYDRLLKECKNNIEAKHIKLLGISEIHRLLNVQGPLVINGVEVLPALNTNLDQNNKITKL
jgi:hypothetical protein